MSSKPLHSLLWRAFGKESRVAPFIPVLPAEVAQKAAGNEPTAISQHPAGLHDRDRQILPTEAPFYLTEPLEVDVRFYASPERQKTAGNRASMPPPDKQKFARVAVVGLPNAGKTSLVNALVGVKIGAVSRLAHTTWDNEEAFYSDLDSGVQLAFVDTPGLANKYDKKDPQIYEAWKAVDEADVVLLVVDAVKRVDNTLMQVITTLKKKLADAPSKPIVLCLTKADLCTSRRQLTSLTDSLSDLLHFTHIDITSTSAHNFGLSGLLDRLTSYALPQEWEVEDHVKHRMSEAEIVEEAVRESLFTRYSKDLPFFVDIKLANLAVRSDAKIKAHVMLKVFNKNRVPIILGKQASGLKFLVEDVEAKIASRYGLKATVTFSVGTSTLKMKEALKYNRALIDDKAAADWQERQAIGMNAEAAKNRADPRKILREKREQQLHLEKMLRAAEIGQESLEKNGQRGVRMLNMDKNLEELADMQGTRVKNGTRKATPKRGGKGIVKEESEL